MRIHEISNDLIGLQELKNTALAFLNPQGEEDKMVLNYIKKLNDREEEKAKIFKKMEKYFFGKT